VKGLTFSKGNGAITKQLQAMNFVKEGGYRSKNEE
jgi:hypothetical protein